jgi:hypothetical protein
VQETVIVYAVLPVFPFALPTTKEPYTTELNTCATAPVTTLAIGPLIVQLVPSGIVGVTPVKVRNITSPYLPEAADIEARPRVAACASLGGETTEPIDTKSAEVSNSTMNRELELRVVKLRHVAIVSRSGPI